MNGNFVGIPQPAKSISLRSLLKAYSPFRLMCCQATGESREITSTTSCLPFLSWICKNADSNAEL
nr:hypothetical protein [Proteus terrae]